MFVVIAVDIVAVAVVGVVDSETWHYSLFKATLVLTDMFFFLFFFVNDDVIVVFVFDSRNLVSKFGQNWVSNSYWH